MLNSHQAWYQALQSKDRRFDGRFFVAVKSTGIYCRPVCPARLPKQQNCQFFTTAAAAAMDGFRPCKRCRPELAPGLSSIDMPNALISQACRWIDHGFLQQNSVEQLAKKLGISSRHLRRLFQDALGVNPLDYACNKQLLMACQLIRDTELSITNIAMQCGFSSLRSFNHRFLQYYQQSPSEFRHQLQKSSGEKNQPITLKLGYRPPFDWQHLLTFLASRVIPGVEAVDLQALKYRRVVCLKNPQQQTVIGWIEVRQLEQKSQLELKIDFALSEVVSEVIKKTRQLFDLDCDPHTIHQTLDQLAEKQAGIRLPGAFDGFEMSVRAILGQQVTVKAAHTIASRVAHAFGTKCQTPFEDLTLAFPSAQTVATLEQSQLGELGIVRQRSKAILAIANAVNQQQLDLSPTAQIDTTLSQLEALPGIGKWTSNYIAMRALGWPDAFLETDLGVIKALADEHGQHRKPKQLLEIAEQWRPWRSYAVMHLWNSL